MRATNDSGVEDNKMFEESGVDLILEENMIKEFCILDDTNPLELAEEVLLKKDVLDYLQENNYDSGSKVYVYQLKEVLTYGVSLVPEKNTKRKKS